MTNSLNLCQTSKRHVMSWKVKELTRLE